MIKQFEEYLREEDKSINTINSYLQHVEGYQRWFEESKGTIFKQLHRTNIKDYISFLKTVKQAKPKTINAKISSLIKFNEFLIEIGCQKEFVISKKDNLKIQNQYTSLATIGVKDVEKLRQLLLDNEKSKRNHALITLLAYAGLRISEALSIRMNDINLVSRELIIKDGKANKTRTVFINDKVKNALSEWLKECKVEEQEVLFVSNRGGKLNRTVINKLFKKYSRFVGKDITPHDLRHFFCSYALSSGLSVHEVANQVGHSNIHTTMIYANPSKQELIDKMNLL